MKTKLFFLGMIILLLANSCQKDKFDPENPDVDTFVTLLKNGSYMDQVGYELPEFSFEDINRLTFYLKDTTNLSMFPTHPISSKYTHPKILNECLFWTIDGIRLGIKYPSLEPSLIDTLTFSESVGYPRLTGLELLKIADKYINWWEEYKKNPSEKLKTKNILENTTYHWS